MNTEEVIMFSTIAQTDVRALRRAGVMAAACLAVAVSAQAQSTADLSGHWEGTVNLPNFQLPLAIDIARGEPGGFVGTLTNDADGIAGLPLKTVTLDGRLVQFVIASGSGLQEYNGVLMSDGHSISGAFSVNGLSAPIDFTRTGDAKIDRPTSAPIEKAIEGSWNGTLDVGGKSMRVVVTLTNHADGTSTGTVINLDGGSVAIPISRIAQQGSQVTLEIRVVSGSYVASLSADGAELAGTWTEKSFSAPMTLRRVASR
jgi:hypothetical protein